MKHKLSARKAYDMYQLNVFLKDKEEGSEDVWYTTVLHVYRSSLRATYMNTSWFNIFRKIKYYKFYTPKLKDGMTEEEINKINEKITNIIDWLEDNITYYDLVKAYDLIVNQLDNNNKKKVAPEKENQLAEK